MNKIKHSDFQLISASKSFIPTCWNTFFIAQLLLVFTSLASCGKGSETASQPIAVPMVPPVVYSGNQVAISLSSLSANATTGSMAAIRSSPNYYRHWTHSYLDYIAHQHQITRSIELNFALSISTSVPDFASRISNGGAKTSVIFQEALQRSDNLIVFFDTMPEWLSSCSSKLGSVLACQAAANCGYKTGDKRYNLYPPGDWTAWTSIMNITVDTLLDLTEVNGKARNIYLEAWNEPNVPECSWNDTHANVMDYYHRTSVAFSQARNALCATKGLSTQRCQRLKFGGPSVGVWNAKIDNNRTTTLIEDLIADSLVQAASSTDHRLDFVSFHGFWDAVPGPRDQISVTTKHIQNAYSASAGTTPAFALPEIVISEWNAGNATRSGTYHPVVMAESYYGLLENNISNAAFATLDAYSSTATMATNDFGLLLPDTVTSNFQRPAYFVYSAFRNLSELGTGQPFSYASDTLKIVAAKTATPNCYNLLVWDFAPDPFAASVNNLIASLTTTASVIYQSYLSASYSGTTPQACASYISSSNNPTAQRAPALGMCDGTPSLPRTLGLGATLRRQAPPAPPSAALRSGKHRRPTMALRH